MPQVTEPIILDSTGQSIVSALNDIKNEINNTGLVGNVTAIVNMYGSKNLNSYPYYQTTKVENGITFTDNGDGSVTVSGTASADAYFTLHNYSNTKNQCVLKKGTYILSGCSIGGSLSTYFLHSFAYVNGQAVSSATDVGAGATLTIENADTPINLSIAILNGTVIPSGGITFKPMIRDARITDDTYVPYAMTNRELTEYVNNIRLNLPTNYYSIDSSTGISVAKATQILSDIYSLTGNKTMGFIVLSNGYTYSGFFHALDGDYQYAILTHYATDQIYKLRNSNGTVTVKSLTFA